MLLFANSLTVPLMLAIILAALIGMTVHEFAHNYVAHLMGDPVPEREGRLTLDPSVHIYWPGFFMFVLIGFGILGFAPIAAHRMRNPRWGYFAAVAAGPISNLIVAIMAGMIIRIVPLSFWADNLELYRAVSIFVLFNVFLFLFNLLPCFPLDGWHMTLTVLPSEQAHWWQKHAMTSQYIFLGLILLSFAASSFMLPQQFNLLGLLLGEIGGAITSMITGL
ncbi:MAG: site-2 protease family protein [Anaerolineaceae bacterium]|nr:MAG: site-2 protease family protein [Anaerolineaceae bacterium]